MNIAVLVKVLPDDADITVNPDRSLNYAKAKNVISTYDLNAIEAAAQFAEKTESRLYAVAVGGSRISDTKTAKNILSRGVDELHILAENDLEGADAQRTASAITSIVKEIGSIDLVIAGDGSADLYAQQVDVHVAEMLGWPCMNAVVEMVPEDGSFVVSRILENEKEVIRLPYPAVVAVSPDVALPRIAGMKDVLAAGKKPVVHYAEGDIDELPESSIEVVEVKAPVPVARKKIIYNAADEGAIDQFVSALREVM